MGRARPLLRQAREQGLSRSPAEVRGAVAERLARLPVQMEREDVGPLLSQLSSCLDEVRRPCRRPSSGRGG